ncbi:MAG: hydrogenase expression protein, partial [Chloroflexota bacterium]
VIASGALIVVVAPEHADGLARVFRAAGIPCAAIGELLPPEQGLVMVRAGVALPLPRFDADEITRLF